MNNNIAVLGTLWGDEGKGHITHYFSPQYDWVVRFAGGANAGHTIYRDGKKYVHNLLPSVDFRNPKTKSFLGSGMVIDLEQLHKEVKNASKDFPYVGRSIFVDPDAFVVLPEHKEEDHAKNGRIGSTNRGIGPAYVSKMDRRGTRVRDLFKTVQEPDFIGELLELGVTFSSVLELKSQFEKSSILFEGAQGVMLDINHGVYPYVSCGDATLGGIFASGFGFALPSKVYGVTKCYTTKVGEGPFPTELSGDEAEELRKRGNEYGATTGRPRRVGWLDLPALKYACLKGCINSLIITKFDILAGMNKIPIASSYGYDPVCAKDFFNTKVQYKDLTGWADVESEEGLYWITQFLAYVEDVVGVPVEYISKGTDVKDIVHVAA